MAYLFLIVIVPSCFRKACSHFFKRIYLRFVINFLWVTASVGKKIVQSASNREGILKKRILTLLVLFGFLWDLFSVRERKQTNNVISYYTSRVFQKLGLVLTLSLLSLRWGKLWVFCLTKPVQHNPESVTMATCSMTQNLLAGSI